jgi:putative sterol carrier protein
VIEADVDSGVAESLYVRLEGRDGQWHGAELGSDRALVDGAQFVLRAPYRRWTDLIRQELHPIKGILQGKIRIEGHLPVILKWTKSMAILAELAGSIDTEFFVEQQHLAL